MKKSIRIALFAVAAIFLFACQKEIESSFINEENTIQLSFNSVKPSLVDVETKTAWTGETITWTKGDAIRVAYTVNDIWQAAEAAASEAVKAKLYASSQLQEDCEIASFAVSANFKDTQNEGLTDPVYSFYAIYPSGLLSGTDFTNPPFVPFNLSSNQTPESSSFDKSVDIMYGTSGNYNGIPEDRNVDIIWNRIVSHADISMRNLQLEDGEAIESITVTAQSGADLAGNHTLNITNGAVSLASGATAVNSVTVNADNLSVSNGSVEFWFTSLPFTASELTFTVKTDRYTYIRQFTGLDLTFKGNARNTLSVNMKKAEKFQNYEESFAAGIGEFITSGDEGIWTAGSYNDDKYMKGTSRINNVNTDGTGWLISPFLSIKSTESELSFNHAINNYFGTVSDEATVWAREKGGEWTQITITYPETPSSGFTSFEATSASLSSFNGKTIQIGFKYIGSTATGVGTWEVKDFKVTNAEVVYYPSFVFTSATTKDVSFSATTVEFTYSATHLTSEPSIAIKAGSDAIIDGTPTIADGVISANIKANDDTENAKQAILVVTCEGVTGIPELVINQAKKENLVEKTATLDFSAQGYNNQQEVSSLVVDPVTASMSKGTNSNAPKYYTSGTALRCYGGNTLTLSSEKSIIKAVFTFASGEGDNAITASVGSYTSGTWTGSAKSVTFTVDGTSGHRRIQKIVVTYLDEAGDEPATPSISLSNVPTANISADGGVVTFNYEITNPANGVTISAAPKSGDGWVNTFDYSIDGKISFVVDPKTTTGTRTTTITVSYTGAESKTFELTQEGTTSGGDETTQEITIEYTGSTTTNMTGENDSNILGLNATDWSIVGNTGSHSLYPGLNKSGYIALYYNASGSNSITVTSSVGTINFITVTYTGDNYSNGKVYVNDSEVSVSDGIYPINSTSFSITNGNTSNTQVRISSIVVNYTPSN